MQWQNDSEASTPQEHQEQQEHQERIGYMGSSHYYEPPAGQTFQQQTYNSPMPGYGPASYGQQPFAGVPPCSDARFSAVLSYSFGWLTGLLFLLFGGKDRFVRFHALQSLVFFGAINVIDFGLFSLMREVWYYSRLMAVGCMLVFLMLNFIAFVSWMVVMIQAGSGRYFRVPFVGDLVARCFGLNSMPRW